MLWTIHDELRDLLKVCQKIVVNFNQTQKPLAIDNIVVKEYAQVEETLPNSMSISLVFHSTVFFKNARVDRKIGWKFIYFYENNMKDQI